MGEWGALGLSTHLRRWQWKPSLALIVLGFWPGRNRWGGERWWPGGDSIHPLTQPNHSLLKSGWDSRVKRFARIHWFVNSSDGQLSRLHLLIRSEFCFGSDLYLLIQQNQTVSQEPIDPVRISNSGWSWHFIPVRSMFCCNFIQKT